MVPSGSSPLIVDRLAGFLGPPAAEHIVILEGEAERIDAAVAGGAGGVAAVLGEPLAQGLGGRRLRRPPSAAGTLGGGGGGGVPSIGSRIHLPRNTGLVRCGYDETASTAAMPSMPPRWLSSGQFDLVGCCWFRSLGLQPVVLRQLVGEDGVVGIDQVEQRTGSEREHLLEEQAPARSGWPDWSSPS